MKSLPFRNLACSVSMTASCFVLLAITSTAQPVIPQVKAQQAAEKAALAEKAAKKAADAEKAAERAAAASKAQQAAEKAALTEKSAKKAADAEKAAVRASTASKAQQAAEKAALAEKSARKAADAEKAAERAATASKSQQAAEKAALAEKSARKAADAEKAAERVSAASKAQQTAEKATDQTEVAQKAANKANVAAQVAARDRSAQQRVAKAASAQNSADAAVKSAQAVAPNPRRESRQPIDTNGTSAPTTDDGVRQVSEVTDGTSNTIAGREEVQPTSTDVTPAPTTNSRVRQVSEVTDGTSNTIAGRKDGEPIGTDGASAPSTDGTVRQVSEVADGTSNTIAVSEDSESVITADDQTQEVAEPPSRSRDASAPPPDPGDKPNIVVIPQDVIQLEAEGLENIAEALKAPQGNILVELFKQSIISGSIDPSNVPPEIMAAIGDLTPEEKAEMNSNQAARQLAREKQEASGVVGDFTDPATRAGELSDDFASTGPGLGLDALRQGIGQGGSSKSSEGSDGNSSVEIKPMDPNGRKPRIMESQVQTEDNRPTEAPQPATRAIMSPDDLKAADSEGTHTVAEHRRAVRDTVEDALKGIGVSGDLAKQIGTEVASPGTKEDGKSRLGTLVDAEGDLQLVGVKEEKRKEIIDAVSRAKDPKAAAEEKVGEAATEEIFGKDIAKQVPPDKRGKFREVFKNLIDIEGQLENLGGDPNGKGVREAIEEGARLGVTDPEDKKRILEKAGQKVLDEQGFTPAKEGETLAQRLDRIAIEQKAELEAMKKAAAAKKKKLAGFPTEGSRIRPGAAGSSVPGKSVAVDVTTAIGGGTGNASGAGDNKTGTGIEAGLKTGSGGKKLEDRPVDFRLVAGAGGGTNSPGNGTSATAPATNEGPAPAPAAPVDNPVTVVEETPTGGGNAPGESAAQPTQPPPADAKAPEGTARAEGSVSVDEGGVLIGGGGSGMAVGHSHQDSVGGNAGHDVTLRSDGTFSGTVFTVVENPDGSKTVSSTPVVGTWAPGPDGNPVVTSQTNSGNSTTATVPASGGAGQTASNENGGGGNSGGQDASGGDDDDDDKDGDDPTLTSDERDAEQERQESENSSETAVATPLHPDFQKDSGTGTRMAEQTGGRVGATEARNAMRGIGLAAGGGGAGGPTDNPENGSGTGVPLNPQDIKVLSKTASSRTLMKTTGGATDPSPIKESSSAITERDLKELSLRGTGGAKGPTDQPTKPPTPVDPNSPVAGPAPIAPPSPRAGTATEAAKGIQAKAVKIEVKADAVEKVKKP